MQSSPLHQPTNTSVLLILAGLDALAEAVVRASNPVKGTAMLSALLHSLTRLSREYTSFLSVLLVNTRGIGHSGRTDGDALDPSSFASLLSPVDDPLATTAAASSSQVRLDGLRAAPAPSTIAIESPLFPSLLTRTLDQGIDVHLMVYRTRGPPIVHVVKDRNGDGTGKWCNWES